MEVLTYEYLIVTAVHDVTYRTESTDYGGQRTQYLMRDEEKTTYYIYRPNATEPEARPGDTLLGTVFNDLGREGWRLVTSDVLDSVVDSGSYHHYGWHEVGVPVRQRWTFIREAAS
jgi:hypothetical protein